MLARISAAIFCFPALTAADVPEGATPMHLVTSPAVSPDGKSMVFEWINDIWTAPTDGGEAVRVVENPARDAYPLFSPDGKRIYFSSDRTGSMQLFSIPADGGEAERHTQHTEGNELECLSPDGKRAIVRGLRDRPGFRATRLMVVDLTRDAREQRLFDTAATSAAWSPDGTRVLFTTGGEQLYRKGYMGSRASQIWEYDIPAGRFTRRVAEETEARAPAWHPDGKGFHYLSGKTGTLNLWSMRDGNAMPVTDFEGDGVFMRQPSADGGTFVFHRGFELFRLRPGIDEEPVPLTHWTRAELEDVSTEERRIRSTIHADFTEDLSQVAFAAAGELWWIDGPDGKTRRLTETPVAESEVKINGEWLYFLRDDGLEPNYFRARFRDGKLTDEQAVTTGALSKSLLKPSPDGGKIAWVQGNGDIFTAAADGSGARRVFECWDRPTFDWAPDGKRLAVAAEDRNANRDIWVVAADGKKPPVNLTRHPDFEGSPRWSPDGRTLVFSARRDGDGKSRLWRIDPDGGAAEVLPTGKIEPTRVVWSADSRSLFFQNRKASDANLYSVSVPGGKVRTVTKQRGVPIRVASDGSLLWRVKQKPAVLKDGKLVVFPISATIERRREDLSRLAFRRVWRTLGERFYDGDMNGREWDALRRKYEPMAVKSRHSRQFDRVVSQLFGELNASHLTFLRRPWRGESTRSPVEKETGHPGLVFRDGLDDGPLVIERVIAGSPAAMLADPPAAGDTVVEIDGEPVTLQTPLHRFFNAAEDKVMPMVIRSAGGEKRVIEPRCISYSRARSLGLEGREQAAAETVGKAGNFAYIAVPNMNRATFDAVEIEVYRASLEADGLILDLRGNGGGREADRMLSMFTQQVHSVTVPRGGPAGYPHARRVHAAWNKPLVVLCDEHTFSNAEIFCHAILQTKRAPVVGRATAGGVISAVKSTIPEAGELQVPFRGWFSAETGKNLDLNGAKPDFPVDLTPADQDAGRDPQLAKALELLRVGR